MNEFRISPIHPSEQIKPERYKNPEKQDVKDKIKETKNEKDKLEKNPNGKHTWYA